MKKFTLLTLFLTLVMTTGSALHAQILRVPAEYTTIQAAVDAAGYGDTILVAPGTYQENIQIIGNSKVVTLASNFIFSSDTNDINNTIIDASQPMNQNYGMGVLLKNQDTTIMTKVFGFTITGGTGYYKTYGGGIYSNNAIPIIEYNHILDCSITGTQPNGGGIYVGGNGNPGKVCLISHNVVRNCSITTASNAAEGCGGGISLNNLKVVVSDNKISGNTITGSSTANVFGGGIYYLENMSFEYHPFVSLRNNEIVNNTIESIHTGGGGICLTNSNGFSRDTIEGNIISYNEAKASDDGGYALGGGIEMDNQAAGSIISGNTISYNRAIDGPDNSDRTGGGIYLWRSLALPTIENTLFEKNRITGNTASDGAGMTIQQTGIKLVNNFISGNEAEVRAGAIFFYGTADAGTIPELINNTITYNSVTGQGGDAGSIYFNDDGRVVMMNDIFFGNQAENTDEMKLTATIVMLYNCDINTNEISGSWGGEANFYADPEFIDDMAWDCYNLVAPCSETGTDEVFAFDQYFDAPGDDFFGNLRPQGESVDVGAAEINLCYVGLPEVVSRQSSVVSYPNPTSTFTTFEYSLVESAMVTLKIFNQVGQEVAIPVNEQQTAGDHQVQWNAGSMPAGVYFYTLSTGKQAHTGKVVVVE
jgi:hypothetical protein